MLNLEGKTKSKRVHCFGSSCHAPMLPEPDNLGTLVAYAKENPADAVLYEVPHLRFQ